MQKQKPREEDAISELGTPQNPKTPILQGCSIETEHLYLYKYLYSLTLSPHNL